MGAPQTDNAVVLPAELQMRLRNMLETLRWNYKIKYKILAVKLDEDVDNIYEIIAGRRLGTQYLLKKIDDYYKSNKLSFDEDGASGYGFGLEYILDALDIDTDVINRSVSMASGKYLLFSMLTNGNITVTRFEMFPTSKQLVVPTFKGRRFAKDGSDLIYKGFYFIHESSLFVFGHLDNKPLVRSLVLVPVGAPNSKDRHGVMTGASPMESIFVSACYLRRLDDFVLWDEFDSIIREHAPSDLRIKYQDIVDNLTTRANLCFAMLREGN